MMDEIISTTEKNTPGYKHLIQALHAQSCGGSMVTLSEPRSGKSHDCNSVLASVLALTLFWQVKTFPQSYDSFRGCLKLLGVQALILNSLN